MIPSIGRIVHYKLSAADAEKINRRRTTAGAIVKRMNQEIVDQAGGFASAWPSGAQAHIGNTAKEGDLFPMLIVRVWGTTAEAVVNGQVFLDGTDVFWVTSVAVGQDGGQWSWPHIHADVPARRVE